MPNAMSSIRDLQIARQHVYQALTSDPAIVESCGPITTIRSQKAGKRWAQNAEFACLCCKLKGQVSFVLCNTQEEVYARQLIAYKLAVTRQLQGIPVLLSPIDCTTRFKMGHKSVNQDGFAVMLTPDEPMLGSIHCDLDLRHTDLVILRVIVSGCGVRVGKHYLFPELTPVAVQAFVSPGF